MPGFVCCCLHSGAAAPGPGTYNVFDKSGAVLSKKEEAALK